MSHRKTQGSSDRMKRESFNHTPSKNLPSAKFLETKQTDSKAKKKTSATSGKKEKNNNENFDSQLLRCHSYCYTIYHKASRVTRILYGVFLPKLFLAQR